MKLVTKTQAIWHAQNNQLGFLTPNSKNWGESTMVQRGWGDSFLFNFNWGTHRGGSKVWSRGRFNLNWSFRTHSS
jgi:hypothetical protein